MAADSKQIPSVKSAIRINYPVGFEARALVLSPGAGVRVPEEGFPVTLALHGMGENAESFAAVLEPAIAKGGRVWVIPDGPHPFEKRREPGIGHAWYLFAGDQQRLRAGMADAAKWLAGLLGRVKADRAGGKIDWTRLDVLGFSQGGYLAGVLWMDMPGVARVVCAGGRLKQEWWPEHAGGAPSFLHLQGADDASVTPAMARQAAEAAAARGYSVDYREFPGVGHAVSASMLEAYMEWEG